MPHCCKQVALKCREYSNYTEEKRIFIFGNSTQSQALINKYHSQHYQSCTSQTIHYVDCTSFIFYFYPLRSVGKYKPSFTFPTPLDTQASTSYHLCVAYLIVNYGSYEESFIAFPICSCLHFAINIFPPICNSEAVTLTLMLMCCIMLLFHYSARFLKNIKSPFCRCSHSLMAQSCFSPSLKINLETLSLSQLVAIQKTHKNISVHHLDIYILNPESFIMDMWSKWRWSLGNSMCKCKEMECLQH